MSYIEITNFRFGLDTRKGVQTSNPGSLVTLQNAWVNQGGEIEKRKAFLAYALTYPLGQTPLLTPRLSYGCEMEANGAVVFGSSSIPVMGYVSAEMVATSTVASATNRIAEEIKNWILFTSAANAFGYAVSRAGSVLTITNIDAGGVLNVDFTATVVSAAGTITKGTPTPGAPSQTLTVGGTWLAGDRITIALTYGGIGLEAITTGYSAAVMNQTTFGVYPTFTTSTIPTSYQQLVPPNKTYTSSDPTMTAVVHSCLFDGKCFVIATFSDGNTWCYYNGTILGDSYLGYIFGVLVGSSTAVFNAIRDSYVTSGASEAYSYVITTDAANGRFNITRTDGATFTIGWTNATTGNHIEVDGLTTNPSASATSHYVIFTGSYAAGDQIVFTLTSGSVVQVMGYARGITALGAVTGTTAPTFCSTFVNKVYLLAGTYAYISEVGSATRFNQSSGTGNGNINMAAFDGIPDTPILCTAPYQGRLAFFFRNSIQIWEVASSLSSYVLRQTLKNTGAVSKLAVVPLGDLDVLYVSDSGVRSLRVRDSSLNATTTDIGSPIDQDIKNALTAAGVELSTVTCGYEPLEGHVWVVIYNTTASVRTAAMWSLSYYSELKVSAWSKYDFNAPTGGGANLELYTAIKFMVWRGAVYARGTYRNSTAVDPTITAGDILLYYSPTTYDATLATVETPWLHAQRPGTNKMCKNIDLAGAGKWLIKGGMDSIGGTIDQSSNIGSTTSPDAAIDSTFDRFSFPVQAVGTHFKLQATSSVAFRVVLSEFVFHYKTLNEKP